MVLSPTEPPSLHSEAVAGTSLYVHVPFCVVKCGYCDFNSFTAEGTEPLDRFLDALALELALSQLPSGPVSVFIGGGTPSHLDPDRLRRLLDILAARVDLAACPEVTVEVNPESTSADKARMLVAAGVDRISMGVQSFAPHRLAFLDRAHDGERARRAVGELREAGCENVSLDMMFGIPGQTVEEWRADLDAAIELGPDHLSCYNLTFEPGTRLHRDLRQGRVTANDEEADRQMFLLTRSRLADAGFHAYEISNFAGAGGPCRHNDHYWLQGDYVGVGPGASSHRAGTRSQNKKPLEAWADAVTRGLPPVASAETLAPRRRAAEALWLGLRRTDGLDLAVVERRLSYPVRTAFAEPLDRGISEELLCLDDGRLRLTAAGLLLADLVGESFLTP